MAVDDTNEKSYLLATEVDEVITGEIEKLTVTGLMIVVEVTVVLGVVIEIGIGKDGLLLRAFEIS